MRFLKLLCMLLAGMMITAALFSGCQALDTVLSGTAKTKQPRGLNAAGGHAVCTHKNNHRLNTAS